MISRTTSTQFSICTGVLALLIGCQGTPDCAREIQQLLKTEKSPEVNGIAASALKRCQKEKVDGYEDMFSTFFSDSDY